MSKFCLVLLLMVVTVLGQSDYQALLELRKGIVDDPSVKQLESWDSSSLASNGCPLDWYGVVCTDGNVASIDLNGMLLGGNFSFPVISGLKMLTNLSISNNRFGGTISDVGSIQSLEILDLSNNLFEGVVPYDIVNLRNLIVLNLSSNNLEGMVPSGFRNLEALRYLDLHSNNLSGDVMNLFYDLGSLVHVDLSSNQFLGSLDMELGSPNFRSSVQYLNISHNALNGELFAHGMPSFGSLEVFDATNNQLAGTIPPFKLITSLQKLRLGRNQFSGTVPGGLLHQSPMLLSELDLSHNQLEGPIGGISSTTLRKLNMSSNSLSGILPAVIAHCAVIDLSNNMLSGNVSRIQNWGNDVEVIHLSSNSLSGTLPNQTSQFSRLSSLKISNNSIDGELPSVLGTYPELKAIDLSLNSLSGSIHPDFLTSTTLTDLNLSANNLSGPLPIQGLPGSVENVSLTSLDLSHNSLAGVIPPEISKLQKLVYLNFSHNSLEGSIPSEIPDGLTGLDVSSNNLSGVVPENLRRFPDSSFLPGNSLLALSISPLSPKGSSSQGVMLPGHRSPRLKPGIKAAIVAGVVGTCTILLLLFVALRTKTQWHDIRIGAAAKGIVRNEGGVQSRSSLLPTTSKNLDGSSSSFHHPQSKLQHDNGDTSSALGRPIDNPQQFRNEEGLGSPMSVCSSQPSPSKSQLSPESPGMLQVYSPDKLAGDLHLFDTSLAFTAEELSRAPAEVIGRSCHGTLYKATLDSGAVLAVKWLKEGISKGRKEFGREVKKLGTIKHPNFVPLVGYYWGPKDHERMIIYSYFDAHCLSLHFQEPRKLPPLSLNERLRVAISISGCLSFIHNQKGIPHGNLKSTNILLQPPHNDPMLADYCLHRVMTSAGTAEQVLNAGALGYRPPEFASSSKPCPSLSSDVYAFGVILLELLVGKSSADIVPWDHGVVDLTDWVRLLAEENRASDCYDKQLINTRNPEEAALRVANQMLAVGLRCVSAAPERPDMKAVFEDLSAIVL
ncbi:Probable inactive receptor kinase At5g10020 [Linum perenne]